MNSPITHPLPPHMTLHRFMRTYAGTSFVAHLMWELAQMPLFTLWQEGSVATILYATIHCTIGDVVIALSALLGAVLVIGNAEWPRERYAAVAIAAVGLGLAYTAYSEWLNVYVRKSWAYADAMPLLFGLGISPLMQWLIIPAILLTLLRRS